MSQKLRFGLIGCGRISYKHIEALSRLYNDAELVSVWDIVQDNADKLVLEYIKYLGNQGISFEGSKSNIYLDLDEMLAKEKLDVVSVCTPSGLHPVHGIKAAKRGIHVITEKPMATKLELGDELINVCEESGVKLFVVKQNRLIPNVQLLKNSIDKGRFGDIYMILVNVLWTRPQSYYNEAKWRGTWEMDGGAFMNQASHYVDAMEWLGGAVESVTAITGTLARNIETEDTGSAVVKFKNGTIGNINVTMLTYPKNFESSITVIGEKGTVRLGGTALEKIEKWEFEDGGSYEEDMSSLKNKPSSAFEVGHTGYYKNVIEVIRDGANPITDGYEGRKSLELITAIYKSSEEGRTVRLPLC